MHLRYLLTASSLGFMTSVLGRNIIDLPPDYETVKVVSKLQSPEPAAQNLLKRDLGGARCGGGYGRCSNGNCCSTAGMYYGPVSRHPTAKYRQDTVETLRLTVALPTAKSTMVIAMPMLLREARRQRQLHDPRLAKPPTALQPFALALPPEPLL